MNKRERILAKSGGVCWYCGEALGKRWHVDHFLPLGRQPDGSVKYPERDAEDILVPACASCNVSRYFRIPSRQKIRTSRGDGRRRYVLVRGAGARMREAPAKEGRRYKQNIARCGRQIDV